ncbi:MAG TPA: hypothetical protein VMS86_05105 [Thermoanaerobaculia bacterium]|nr:hypothetical protein [Thermoanaerobaculia bacterium]
MAAGTVEKRRAGSRRSGRDAWRLVVATALVAAWMLLLLFGHPFGAAVHILLLAALLTVPWRLLHP